VRWSFFVLGVFVCLVGLVWILQGLNVLPGSRMSGEPFWAIMGAVAIAAGIGLGAVGRRLGRGAG